MTIDLSTHSAGNDILPLLESFVGKTGGLISALRAVMLQRGYVSPGCLPQIAEVFNLSQAEVLGVVSFYDDFATTPPARHCVRICEAEACQASGAKHLLDHMHAKRALVPGSTSVDKHLRMSRVACLGLCACGPALELDGKIYGRMNAEALEGLLKGLDNESKQDE